MNRRILISCPESEISKAERISGLLDSCFEWLYSEPLRKLVKLFDGEELANQIGHNRETDLDSLHRFAERWDFRKGKERWAVDDGQFVARNQEYIMEQATILGLKDVIDPHIEPDYILPLGGARLSNYVRPKMAKKIIDEKGYVGRTIVALSGTRPLNEIEMPFVEEYAPDALTEFDAINGGLEKAFGLNEFSEERIDNDNINLCSAVRKYKDQYKGSDIYSLAAPSSDPEHRRANSYDTFEFFLDHFNIADGKKLLLVTSCIYVPFQYLKFMGLAINGGFDVDCIGSDVVDSGSLSKPSNYLQEIKGTIDAIYGLYHQFESDNK